MCLLRAFEKLLVQFAYMLLNIITLELCCHSLHKSVYGVQSW